MNRQQQDWQLQLGASPEGDGVRFRVWAPDAQRVEIELSQRTGESLPRYVGLEREANGTWVGHVAGIGAGARYRYRVDGGGSFPDPYSRSQPDGPHGPSEVIDPAAFHWHDGGWRGVSADGLVVYQCHIGTFTQAGTFDAAIEQLPRLARLGVTAIQLLPIAEFPGTRNWGYEGVDLFAPTRNYGGYAAFQRFVDAAHRHGLGVIVDGVYNHLGPDGNYLRAYSRDYFTDRYQTPWGEAINYDGPRSTWVRRFVVDNARYWLRELHADGLRLDATQTIFDASPMHILAELSETLHSSLPDEREFVLIAETPEDDARYLASVDRGGFGIDAVYADDFHHVVRRFLAGDRDGYYSRYQGTLEELARCIEGGWLRGSAASELPARGFVYAIQNHDQVGNRAFGDRLHHQIDLDRYRAASVLLLFLPFTPLLFMGQEFATSSPFQFFTDHNRELGRLVTEGRRREFAAFSAFADPAAQQRIPDPQAEATFLRSKLQLTELEGGEGADVHELYERLLNLRRTDAVLAAQDRTHLEARALRVTVLAVRRWNESEERLLLTNFDDEPHHVSEFGAGWRVVLDSSGPSAEDSRGISLPPRSASILARSFGT